MAKNTVDTTEEEILEGMAASKQVIEASKASIDLDRVFHPALALAIRESARAKSVPIEWFVTALLPVFASLIGRTTVWAVPDIGYKQALVLFGLVLGQTGTAKSAVLDEIFSPLIRLDSQFKHEYQMKKLLYERTEKKQEMEKPVEPWFYSDEATVESLGTKTNPMGGFVLRADEAEHLLRKLDAYKGKKNQGADALQLNNLWNGTSAVTLRVQDSRVLKNPRINIIGFGHPDATSRAMNEAASNTEETDTRGFNARFIITMKPATLGELSLEPAKANLVEVLAEIYSALTSGRVGVTTIGNKPANVVSLDAHVNKKQCGKLLVDLHADDVRFFSFEDAAQKRLVRLRRERNGMMQRANEEAIRAIYPKMEAHSIRIAGVLHVVNHILDGKAAHEVPAEISLQTFEAAIHLAMYYARQSEALFRLNRSGKRDPQAAKILSFLQGKGSEGAKPRDIQQSKGWKQDVIRPVLEALVTDGEVLEQDGRYYLNVREVVGAVGKKLVALPTPKTQPELDMEENVGDVDPSEDDPALAASFEVTEFPWGEDEE